MDLMNLITGGAQPLVDDNSIGARSDPSQSGPTMNPNLEALLRAIAMQKMQQEPPQQGWPEAAPAAGFQPGGAPQMMPNLADMPGPGPAPAAPVAQPANDGKWPTGAATDFSGVPRAKAEPQTIMRPDAPPDFPLGMPQQQPSMQDMIPSPQERALKNAASAFGAGIAKMPGNTKMSAFGRGMGGSIAGGDAAEKQDFDESAKALEAVRKAAASGDESAYKSALAQYYQAYAAKMRSEIGPDGQKIAGSKDTAPERMIARIQESYKARTGQDLPYDKAYEVYKSPQFQERMASQERINNQRNASSEARAEFNANSRDLTARDKPSMDDLVKKRQNAYGSNAPAANREQPVGQNRPPAEIDFGGGGSQADPYKPMTREQFMQIPPGAFYLNPKTGTVDVKKAD